MKVTVTRNVRKHQLNAIGEMITYWGGSIEGATISFEVDSSHENAVNFLLKNCMVFDIPSVVEVAVVTANDPEVFYSSSDRSKTSKFYQCVLERVTPISINILVRAARNLPEYAEFYDGLRHMTQDYLQVVNNEVVWKSFD